LVLDVSADGRQLAYRTVRRNRQELWVRSDGAGSDHLSASEDGAQILQPKWSNDGTRLAYLRRTSAAARPTIVLLDSPSAAERHIVSMPQPITNLYHWTPDGTGVIVGCQARPPQIALCLLTVSASADPKVRLLASDQMRHLFAAQISPNGRWISFHAQKPELNLSSTVYVMPAAGGPWVSMTDGQSLHDKPRWSPDGRTLYFLSKQDGFWNLWGRRFDPRAGTPVGEAFQVTRFESPDRLISSDNQLQLSITRDRLILPITETSGAVWVLDRVNSNRPEGGIAARSRF
jgi:Tol biopolymer transport system component